MREVHETNEINKHRKIAKARPNLDEFFQFFSLRSMGIQGLSKLVADVAAHAIKENEIKNYFGRKIAIDASMSLYQFLIAIR
jgi:hypothetical protein